jgi:hypothetical protein
MLITPLEFIPAEGSVEKPKFDNLSGARSGTDAELIQSSSQISAIAELRFRRDVETIDRLGSARVWHELLLELGRRHGLQVEIAATVEKYAGAGLTPELLAIIGGDRMVPLPILLVR